MIALQQMDDRVDVKREWMGEFGFHLVDSIEKLKRLVDLCIERGLYSIDVETTGINNSVYKDEFFDDGKKTRNGIRTVDRIVGVCVSFDGKNGYYIPLSHEPEDSGNLPWDPAWDELSRLVHSKAKAILHRSVFDLEFLYPVTGKEFWTKDEFEDTLLMYRVIMPLRSSPAGLKPLTKQFFGYDSIEIDELFSPELKEKLRMEKMGINFALLHPKEGLAYGACDGIFTYKLLHVLKDKLSSDDLRVYNLEKSFVNVMRKMERNRVRIDVKRVNELLKESKDAALEVGDIIRDIIESKTGNTGKWLTLNIGSPKQLSSALFTNKEGVLLKPIKEMLEEENSGFGKQEDPFSDSEVEEDEESSPDAGEKEKQYETNDVIVKALSKAYGKDFTVEHGMDSKGNPIKVTMFDLILEYRHYDKMKGSYVGKFAISHDKYGDVRPNFNQLGTDTCRLAATAGKIKDGYSGVAFQGIPRDSDEDKPELFKQIRTCIIPRPGYLLVKLDFAGEELRVVTNLSGDPVWTDSFLNKDGDVHSITAKTLFRKDMVNKDERNRGKRCNFAFIYGGGAGAIQRNIDCSMEEAEVHMSNLRNDVPVLMGYVEHQKQYARKYKCIHTAYGRRIPIPTIDSPIRGIRKKAERCAINYTIQGTSADIIKYAMCFVDKNIRQLGWDDRVKYVLTVHDEVVYEVRPEHLVEVVRKLDEWMTYPWKLPKAHGRDWVVPLLTEPGVDIHWRARYDLFHMVDGVLPDPKDMDANGNFKGKLKGDHYFDNGRIYQKIPDFLEPYVKRSDKQAPVEIENKGEFTPPKYEPPVSQQEPDHVGISESSPQIVQPTQVVNEKPKEDTVYPVSKSVKLDRSLPPEKVQKDTIPVKNKVFRWVMKAQLTENTQRKLHALCVLCEGETLIRVVNLKDSILVSESENICVDETRFAVIAELFGLGLT
jgi:DNA polymerase I-like protein with 3'-5' exonuclease and polymerase domains